MFLFLVAFLSHVVFLMKPAIGGGVLRHMPVKKEKQSESEDGFAVLVKYFKPRRP